MEKELSGIVEQKQRFSLLEFTNMQSSGTEIFVVETTEKLAPQANRVARDSPSHAHANLSLCLILT